MGVGRTTRLGIAEKELTMLRRTLAALLMLAAIGTPAVGQEIAYDGFNYATGTNLNGFNGGSGWAGAWSEPSFGTGNSNDNVPETIQAGSLTFSSLATGGNRVVTGGRFSYDIRNLGAALGTARAGLPRIACVAETLSPRSGPGSPLTKNGPGDVGLHLRNLDLRRG